MHCILNNCCKVVRGLWTGMKVSSDKVEELLTRRGEGLGGQDYVREKKSSLELLVVG